MNSETFLAKLSAQIKLDFPQSMNDLVVVLPNKRAKIFLLEELKKQYEGRVFAPEIISIEELIQEISGLRSIDSVELLFEFYVVYRDLLLEQSEDFDHFANWANMLLQDFNEIDRYLLDPKFVFSYLKDIEDLKHWALDIDNQTDLIKKYLEFWNKMPIFYKHLYQALLNKKIGYQGLVYREAVGRHKVFLEASEKTFYFAGFNALNAAEEVIIQTVLELKKGNVFWDIDKVFMDDPYHDAGLFLRRIKKSWKYYHTHDFEWIVDEFSQAKNIKVINTPKSVGQAKIAGQIIEQIAQSGQTLDKVAVVLGEENLLLPVLHSLPIDVRSLNITMGYSGSSNPVQILLNKIFKLHLNAIRRSSGANYTVYYKEILDVLDNPILVDLLDSNEISIEINKKNLTFFSLSRFDTWLKDERYPIRSLIFTSWRDKSSIEILQCLIDIVLQIKASLDQQKEHADRLNKTFLYAAFQMLNRLVSYCQKYNFIQGYETLYALYKQIMELAEVSFEGEPLEGLQIMGVLESRVLDFDTVIVTSVNEGKFPAGKSQNSFIPYDIKREIGLPTFKEKDAIYSFHFYHLLLRAKNVYLIYNSQTEGMDAGERSRFLTQLEIEPHVNHEVEYLTYSADMPGHVSQPLVMHKSKLLLMQLESLSTIKGFSPSALTTYLRDPMQFYMQQILKIREVEEVEESVALNTLGTIIHNALEELYTPAVKKELTVDLIKVMQQKANSVVQLEFEKQYNNDKQKMGKNLLAFEVAKSNVQRFLSQELLDLSRGDQVTILELESRLEYVLRDPRLPYDVKIFGLVDRIEQRNGKIRIIDYKTGKVEKKDLKLDQWEGLTSEYTNDKIIQLLCYALMYSQSKVDGEFEAGIYSFKNSKEGFLFFGMKTGRGKSDDGITQQTIDLFKDELVTLLLEILNPEQDFIQNMDL